MRQAPHQVVIRTRVEATHPIGHGIPCGQHDNGHIRGLPDAAAQVVTVRIRKHEIQDDQIGLPVAEVAQRLLGAGRRIDLVALKGQTADDKPGDPFFVLDQENPSTHS